MAAPEDKRNIGLMKESLRTATVDHLIFFIWLAFITYTAEWNISPEKRPFKD